MRLPGPRKYPRQFLIQTGPNIEDCEHWEIHFVRELHDGTKNKNPSYGICNPEDNTILIAQGLSKEDLLHTVIHELIHAVEFSLGKDIPHTMVYVIESVIGELVADLIRKS